MKKPILQVKNLTKKYSGIKYVDNISFDLYQGEIVGFLGPNGAGKTTTIRMITNLTKPTSGTVYIDGININKKFEAAIEKVGAIVENPSLYEYMSGYNNLKYYSNLHKNITKDRINEVVKIVNMQNRIHDKVKKYSLGMKQRLGIAQALLHEPKLLILDEPTNGLDAPGIRELRTLFKHLSKDKGIAIMVSSHILSEMELLCDRVIFINDGKITKDESIRALKAKSSNNNKLKVMVNYPNYAGKLIIENYNRAVTVSGNHIIFKVDKGEVPGINSFLVKNKISIYALELHEETLEDIFMGYLNQNGLGEIRWRFLS